MKRFISFVATLTGLISVMVFLILIVGGLSHLLSLREWTSIDYVLGVLITIHVVKFAGAAIDGVKNGSDSNTKPTVHQS